MQTKLLGLHLFYTIRLCRLLFWPPQTFVCGNLDAGDDGTQLRRQGSVVACREIDYATETVAHCYDRECLGRAVAAFAEHIPYG